MKTAFISWCACFWGSSLLLAAPSGHVFANQSEAVRLFPELGLRGSPLNSLFLERYSDYRRSRPDYFASDEWPIQLAQQCADELQKLEKKWREAREQELAEIERRTQAFRNYPVPEPAKTPYDDDSDARAEYLRFYRDGYRSALAVVGVPIWCGVGPSIAGHNAGAAAAQRDSAKNRENATNR